MILWFVTIVVPFIVVFLILLFVLFWHLSHYFSICWSFVIICCVSLVVEKHLTLSTFPTNQHSTAKHALSIFIVLLLLFYLIFFLVFLKKKRVSFPIYALEVKIDLIWAIVKHVNIEQFASTQWRLKWFTSSKNGFPFTHFRSMSHNATMHVVWFIVCLSLYANALQNLRVCLSLKKFELKIIRLIKCMQKKKIQMRKSKRENGITLIGDNCDTPMRFI